MDYPTKPLSRKGSRYLAKIFCRVFGLSPKKAVPVIELLDKFCLKMTNVTYDIVDDDKLPHNVPALTEVDDRGVFTIKIKNEVYEGASERSVGGYRNHIMHEMCHVFLYRLGYRPILARSFANNTIPPAYSAEWQAKALCGEIMMPYEETKNMNADQIVRKYKVSLASARMRKKY